MPTVQIAGSHVESWELGGGEPVVLLHSSGNSSGQSRALAEPMPTAQLAPSHKDVTSPTHDMGSSTCYSNYIGASEHSKNLPIVGARKTQSSPSLHPAEKRLASQIEGRTCANLFGLVGDFLDAKVMQMRHSDRPCDPISLGALLQLRAELEHQQMFRHIERMAAAGMPEGYAFAPDPSATVFTVLGKSAWSVLALICHIELFVLSHYQQSIELDANLSPLCKDVFLDHWREESKHAVLAELEWKREDSRLTAEQRELAVDDLINMEAVVGGILRSQAQLDADYFLSIRGWTAGRDDAVHVRAAVLDAYRGHYIGTGVRGRFGEVLTRMITPAQYRRLAQALARI
jgi:P-aminobenzoate N-oxygenase AurF